MEDGTGVAGERGSHAWSMPVNSLLRRSAALLVG